VWTVVHTGVTENTSEHSSDPTTACFLMTLVTISFSRKFWYSVIREKSGVFNSGVNEK